ncbi:MAG: FecR domain-containing protein [Myxococcaceae bacterium]|jgi:TolA-binding protein|nr:FecR domain-containing protein [Myxococcaceae bacterium]MCA3015253.1 FecR domain-containing protein [Myxococcaceae bacterium]
MKTELERLGREAGAWLEPEPAGQPPEAFLDAADGTARRRRTRGALATCGLVVVLLGAWGLLQGEPASREVRAEAAGEGTEARVLSDGTVIEFRSSSVVDVDDALQGPVVRLGKGRMLVRAGGAAPTTVKLGRWVVHLTGSTRFAADFSQGEGTLVVLEGAVEVRDGVGSRVVRAGDELALASLSPPAVAPVLEVVRAPVEGLGEARAPSANASFEGERGPAPDAPPRLDLTPGAPAVGPTVAPAPRPMAASPKSRPSSGAGGARPEVPGAAQTQPPVVQAPAGGVAQWADWLAEGRASAVVDDALPRLDQALASERAAALLALADAARFEQRLDVAERACQALRARFSGSPEAAQALFVLARLAERRGDVAEALTRFEAYSVEAPAGPLVAEALARRVQLEAARGANERACALAREYLSRFPGGALARHFRERCGLE